MPNAPAVPPRQADIMYVCANAVCPEYNKPVTFEQAVVHHSIRKNMIQRGIAVAAAEDGAVLACDVEQCRRPLVQKTDEAQRRSEVKHRFNVQLKVGRVCLRRDEAGHAERLGSSSGLDSISPVTFPATAAGPERQVHDPGEAAVRAPRAR